MNTVAIIAEYRARGLDLDDEEMLRREVGSLGPMRLRALHLPEAGGSFEVDLVFQFIGTAFASGVLGHIATKWYDGASARIGRFVQHKVAKREPPDLTVTFSYDDIDIRIPMIAAAELGFLQNCGELLRAHLKSPALRRSEPTAIVIGMCDGGANEWSEPNAANALEPDRRYWGISLETHRLVTHLYDTETRLLATLSADA